MAVNDEGMEYAAGPEDHGNEPDLTPEEPTEQEGEGQEPSPEGEESLPLAADPYAERFKSYDEKISAYEREINELKSGLQNVAERKHAQPTQQLPAALNKPRNQWTEQDLFEYNDWQIRTGLDRMSKENEWAGRLSAEVLGPGNDYRAVVGKYLDPVVQDNPEIAPFIRELSPPDRYMLGLMHEVHARSGGDLVKTVQAIRSAIGARQAGARDVVRNLKQASKGAAMKVAQGKGGRQSNPREFGEKEWQEMNDDEFAAYERKIAGG